MQACERRNYESKTTWHHHTNKEQTNNTSCLQQVLKKQYNNFRSGWMKYKTGLKAFSKKRTNKKKDQQKHVKKPKVGRTAANNNHTVGNVQSI